MTDTSTDRFPDWWHPEFARDARGHIEINFTALARHSDVADEVAEWAARAGLGDAVAVYLESLEGGENGQAVVRYLIRDEDGNAIVPDMAENPHPLIHEELTMIEDPFPEAARKYLARADAGCFIHAQPTDGVTYLSPAQFVDLGLLQEVNRQFFHPRGLALEIQLSVDATPDGSGLSDLFVTGIWDDRGEGMFFAPGVIDPAKAASAASLIRNDPQAVPQR